ncbi:MAG: ArsA family ATPase [Solirubrobacterales bacterium]
MDFLDKRLLVVSGKGGVGKSTVSLALGMAAARGGKRTLVCEVSSQERASRVFGRADIGFSETEIDDNLWAFSIDPEEALREYVLLQIRVKAARDVLFRSKVFTYLADATPGLREMVTMGKVWELAQLDRKVKRARPYDLVIVDAPATGHGVGLLKAPKTFADIARVGPIASQGMQMHGMLTDHAHTGAVLVSLPEEMPVNETGMLERELTSDVGIAVDRVYLNGLYPERFSAAEGTKLEKALATDDAPAAVRAGVFEHRRRETQTEQLDRLRHRAHAPVHTLPFIFQRELGITALQRLSAELA